MSSQQAFPIAMMLLRARTDAARAAILLALSDAVVLSAPIDLGDACAAHDFTIGQVFVAKRAALLCRTRDAHGLLPEAEAAELERLRVALSELAAGMGAAGG